MVDIDKRISIIYGLYILSRSAKNSCFAFFFFSAFQISQDISDSASEETIVANFPANFKSRRKKYCQKL
jgi:hypothetical protein